MNEPGNEKIALNLRKKTEAEKRKAKMSPELKEVQRMQTNANQNLERLRKKADAGDAVTKEEIDAAEKNASDAKDDVTAVKQADEARSAADVLVKLKLL